MPRSTHCGTNELPDEVAQLLTWATPTTTSETKHHSAIAAMSHKRMRIMRSVPWRLPPSTQTLEMLPTPTATRHNPTIHAMARHMPPPPSEHCVLCKMRSRDACAMHQVCAQLACVPPARVVCATRSIASSAVAVGETRLRVVRVRCHGGERCIPMNSPATTPGAAHCMLPPSHNLVACPSIGIVLKRRSPSCAPAPISPTCHPTPPIAWLRCCAAVRRAR